MKLHKTKDVTVAFGDDDTGRYEITLRTYAFAEHELTIRDANRAVSDRFVIGMTLAQLKAAIAELEKELAV